MRSFFWKHRWLFALGTLAGWGLRGHFLKHYALINGDALIYGEIAKSWLQTGVFGMDESGNIVPTLIRLPGYPAFLAVIFNIFGVEHYTAVLRAQLAIDLASCFVIAEITRRTVSKRAARIAFILAVLCPFTANYCAAPLTETLSIFATAIALLAAVCALEKYSASMWYCWAVCGLAVGAAILLRPDGVILLVAILLYLGWQLLRSYRSPTGDPGRFLTGGVIVLLLALAPLAPWTLRNWHVFHVIQPLAPRYANAPGEFVPMGFNRWMKTWCVEFVSTNDVYWKVSADSPGEEVNFSDLPDRAFDNSEQRQETRELIDRYNHSLLLTPDLDMQFAKLAQERIQHSAFRYYIWLPFLRVADMWLRPRTEMFNLDLPWWKFEDTTESVISIALATINAIYLFWAAIGIRKSADVRFAGLLILFILLRSLMLATLENPEPRYTLECFPAVFVLAAAGISSIRWKRFSVIKRSVEADQA